MLLSQAAYRGAGLAAPLATLTVVNPVVAAAVGITMFGETFRYGTTGTVLALGCGVVAAGGLILLTTERLGSARRTADGRRRPHGSVRPVRAGAGIGAWSVHGLPAEQPARGSCPSERVAGPPGRRPGHEPAGGSRRSRLVRGRPADGRPSSPA